MGLAIQTGVLADLLENDEEGAEWLRDSLSKVNEVLAECGLPEYFEPSSLPSQVTRAAVGGFPYSFLHYLRRAYAHGRRNPSGIVPPAPKGTNPAQDPVLDEEMNMMDSHLLCHSDCKGFYLPIDFQDVIVDGEGERIEGGLLGSSYRLLEELTQVAPRLGISLVQGRLSDSEADKINSESEAESSPLWIEKTVWLTFYEAARLSIEHKTAICFS